MEVLEDGHSVIDEVRKGRNKIKINDGLNFPIVFTTLVLSLNSIVYGAGTGYTSPALPDINSDSHSPFHFNDEQGSWVVSAFPLGAIVGSLGGSYVMGKYGRKMAVLHSSSMHVFGWLLMTVAWNSSCVYVGRAIVGYAGVVVQVSVPVYLAEVTEANIRGFISCSYGIGIAFGILVMNLLGCFVHWRWLALSCLAMITVETCLVVFIPESPRYLLSNGLRDEALRSFEWFFPNSDPKEFRQLEDDINANSRNADGSISNSQASFAEVFRQKNLRKPMLLATIIYCIQIFTGIDYVWFYTVSIFQDSGIRVTLNSNMLAVASSVFCVLGGFVASFLFDRLGRRILLLTSAALCSLCMLILGIHYKLKEIEPSSTMEKFAMLPVVSVAAFQFFISIGLAPGPSIIFGEIIQNRARAVSGGIACIMCWIAIFVVSKFGVTIAKSTPLHDYGLFWIFAAITLVGAVYIFFCLPETKGKTLEEIEKIFN